MKSSAVLLVVFAGAVLWRAHPGLVPAAVVTGIVLRRAHRARARRHRREHPQAAGYLVWAEWGPDMLRDRDERLAEVFPETDTAERARWADDFARVDETVWSFARAGAGRADVRGRFDAYVAREHPFLDERARAAAWTQAAYHAMREGWQDEPEELPERYAARG